jgi:hypothetical protein
VVALFAAGAAAAPLNPGLARPQVIARLVDLRAEATIVPAHLHRDFVITHAAVAGTAWKLALQRETIRSCTRNCSLSRQLTARCTRRRPDSIGRRRATSRC